MSDPSVQVGNHIDVQTQKWVAQDAGIGAGVDSYFEYLVKGAILLQDEELLGMFLGKNGAAGSSPTGRRHALTLVRRSHLVRVRSSHPELHPLRRLVPVGPDAQGDRVHAGVPVAGGLLARPAGTRTGGRTRTTFCRAEN